MDETEFFNAIEKTLALPYRENAGYYDGLLTRLDERLAAPPGVFDIQTRSAFEACKVRLTEKKSADMAPVIGASFTRLD